MSPVGREHFAKFYELTLLGDVLHNWLERMVIENGGVGRFIHASSIAQKAVPVKPGNRPKKVGETLPVENSLQRASTGG
jgi:hypothetical protein